MQSVCKQCNFSIQESFYFCPNCGKKIKDPPFKFSIIKTILIMLESLFLPPFGLFPGFRYLLNKDSKAKIIGLGAIILTIISTLFLIYFTFRIINNTNKVLNNIYDSQELLNNPGSASNQNESLERIQKLQELGF